MEAVLSIVVIVVVFGAIFGGAWYARKRRREGWQALARTMGLEYQEDGRALAARLSGFKLFGLGRNRKTRDVVSGPREDGEIALADHSYVTGSGKNSTTHAQTICVLRAGGPSLTHCFLRRQVAVFDFLGKVFGGQDIDVPDDRAFSKAFVLQGRDEAATRALFGPDVRRLFLSMDDRRLQLECVGDTVLLHLGRKLPLREVEGLVERASRIRRALAAAAAQPGDGAPPTLSF